MRRMQCKDISDDEFLEAVDTAGRLLNTSTPLTRIARFADIRFVLSGFPEWVGSNSNVDREENLLPLKLVLAKARKLVRKGKLEGCYCGYRGDFRVVGETPSERIARRLIEKRSEELYELEGVAREWRIRDEKIQKCEAAISSYEKGIENIKDAWAWGESEDDLKAREKSISVARARIQILEEEIAKLRIYSVHMG